MSERSIPPANIAELEEALRHLHQMEMQTKLRLEQVEATVAAAVKLLARAQVIHETALSAEAEEQRVRIYAERRNEVRVLLGPDEDKYAVETSKVNCSERMHLCKAGCCRLAVALDFKDIDDGLRWEYARPYELKRDKGTGYCVYSEAKSHRCNCYEIRPSICRTYDCTNDKRIWDDFAAMKPAKWLTDVSVTPLIQIRLPPK